MAAAKAFARYFREETALERAAVRITRSARTYRFCQRGDALYGGAAEKMRAWRRALCRKSAKKMLSARQKDDEMRLFGRRHRSDRGARRRIKSGVKFWRIKLILSALRICTSRLLSGACGEKNRYAEEGAEHRETAKRIFGRVKSSGWAAAFFRTTPVFYILCAERFRDARGALFERAHYTDADHLFCRCY